VYTAVHMAIGVRQLRSDLAAHVRRAAGGETTIISVGGHPAAALGPLAMREPSDEADLSSLVASGAVIAPRRADRRVAEGTVPTWANVRLDRLLREIRG
jgi:antitoxin (DNA-binding transcriptional repressor) of toxin-antitoxin stability system